MAQTHAMPAAIHPSASIEKPVQRFFAATELDTRMLGMVAALALIWVGFHVLSGGLFLTPRNLWNLSVQTASVAIMATGMVLVIVTRHIDLSVGSILGFVAMIMGVTQAEILPQYLGFGHPAIWAITLLVGVAAGVAIGAVQGAIIAYQKVPAFIVTLGGYLVWRGGAWWVTSGRTVAPMDTTFALLGGGPTGAVGATWSWVIGVAACVAIVLLLYFGRRQRRRFNFPLRPMWAEATLAVLGCGASLGAVWVANSYPWPVRIAERYATANNIPIPEGGLFIPHGLAVPVLLALVAELAGINTRWVTVKIFMVMGALCAISAAISAARLNAATNAMGTLDELYVIAAAVIGGTSLAGGMGTVAGAMLGALVMQSLQSGMVLMGMDSPLQSIVVGVVLVFAVWLDTLYRRRAN